MTRPQTEILVHIAAASRASDDACYRALAQAYADFEPAGRLDVVRNTLQKGSGSGSTTPNVISFEEYWQLAGSIPVANATNRSFQFATLSFESVWDNVKSPGITALPHPKRVMGPTLSRAPPQRLHHYVSPDECIPDSQPDDEQKTRRRRISAREDDLGKSPCGFDMSRIEESQEASSTAESDDEESAIRTREAGSPDLSVMPMGQKENSKFGESQDQLQPMPTRQPLSLRSANSQQSSQQDDDGSLKSSLPLPGWEVVPSSIVDPLLDCGDGQSVKYGINIPSSLPGESGKVVLRVNSSSCDFSRGSSASLPSSAVPELLRADSEPTGTKRHRRLDHGGEEETDLNDVPLAMAWRRASDAGQPLHKKKRTISNIEAASASAAIQERVKETAGTSDGTLRASTQQFPSSSPTASAPGLYLDQTLRIISPEPPIACEHLDAASLITEKMAKLARDLNLERRYRPLPPSPEDKAEGHAVRPFERGYWRLNTSGWPATLRHQAWAFLTDYVGVGDAGWSVWCSRDPAPHTWLRLHCFAATAGHTYLILYLASQRQILTTGAVWMDGAGTPTISVLPRKKKKQQSGGVDVFTNGY